MEELIVSKASSLFFTYGLKSISMDDLAKEAGVSKKTIYQLVPDKNELVKLVVLQLLQCHQDGLERCRETARDAVEEVVLQAQLPFSMLAAVNHSFFYDLEKFFPEAWQLVQKHRQQYLLPQFTSNLHRGIAEGLYRNDIDLELTPEIRMQQYVSALQPGAFTELLPNLQQLMNRLSLFYLQGITNEKGRRLVTKYMNNLK